MTAQIQHRIGEERNYSYDGKRLDAGLVRIVCDCGWAVCHSRQRAWELAEDHIRQMEADDARCLP